MGVGGGKETRRTRVLDGVIVWESGKVCAKWLEMSDSES